MCYSCCTQSCIFLWSARGHNTAAAFLRWCHKLAHNNVPKKSIQSFPTLASCHKRWPVRFVKLKGCLFLKSSLGKIHPQRHGFQCTKGWGAVQVHHLSHRRCQSIQHCTCRLRSRGHTQPRSGTGSCACSWDQSFLQDILQRGIQTRWGVSGGAERNF